MPFPAGVPSDVQAVVDQFRALITVDGGRLVVREGDARRLVLDLVLEDAGCAECVMPRDHLEGILRDRLSGLPTPPDIVINDPREPSTTSGGS